MHTPITAVCGGCGGERVREKLATCISLMSREGGGGGARNVLASTGEFGDL